MNVSKRERGGGGKRKTNETTTQRFKINLFALYFVIVIDIFRSNRNNDFGLCFPFALCVSQSVTRTIVLQTNFPFDSAGTPVRIVCFCA